MNEEAVAWLREQIQARLAAAKAAMADDGDDGVWHAKAEGDADAFHWAREVRGKGIHIYDEGGHDEAQATHIAANDPQDVIARCEAELGIITRCELVQAAFRDPAHGMWPDVSRRERTHANAILAMLASGYRHRPGYGKHWGEPLGN